MSITTNNIFFSATAALLERAIAYYQQRINAVFNIAVPAVHAAAHVEIELTPVTTPAVTIPEVTTTAVTTTADTTTTSTVLVVASVAVPVLFVVLAPSLAPSWLRKYLEELFKSRAEAAIASQTSQTCTTLVVYTPIVTAIAAAAHAEIELAAVTTPARITIPAVTRTAGITTAVTTTASSVFVVTSVVTSVVVAPSWVRKYLEELFKSRADAAIASQTSQTCTTLVVYTPIVTAIATMTATAPATSVRKKPTLRIDVESPPGRHHPCTTPPSRPRSGNFNKLRSKSKVNNTKKVPNYMKSTRNVRTRRSKSTRKKQTNFCLDWNKSKTQRFSTSTKKGQRRNLTENQKARNTRTTTSKKINKCRQRRAQLDCICSDYKL